MLSLVAGLCFLVGFQAKPPRLDLPPRNPRAINGSQLAIETDGLSLQDREDRFFKEIRAGNIPSFLREFVPINLSDQAESRELRGTVFVLPDYLAIGSDDDFLYVPLTPYTAQRLATFLHCSLPTPKLVDAIYGQATLKLKPQPIPPSPEMTRVKTFLDHTVLVMRQIRGQVGTRNSLVAGHKKDVVITKGLVDHPGRVAIYGWHQPDGKPIQPLYLGHDASWADYSHGIRLVSQYMLVNGKPTNLFRTLNQPLEAKLVSDEGILKQPGYKFSGFPSQSRIPVWPGETNEWLNPASGVRVLINRPAVLKSKVRLVLYALPNGNTIEQTFGSRMGAGKDWHFDIQHIAAQTRYLRNLDRDESLVVAYLEASNHSWPAFLHSAKSDQTVPIRVYSAITHLFGDRNVHVVLDSHSGGGAFIFDLIKAWNQIPYQVDRIAFLDSEYNYESNLHSGKLARWLERKNCHLCVVAYDDANALYEGKPFVSAMGGTWGRSHAMLRDLSQKFKVEMLATSDPERWEGLAGQIVFLLKENPSHKIFHTVQVERNGFIESLLSGEHHDQLGYRYFGSRTYNSLISN